MRAKKVSGRTVEGRRVSVVGCGGHHQVGDGRRGTQVARLESGKIGRTVVVVVIDVGVAGRGFIVVVISGRGRDGGRVGGRGRGGGGRGRGRWWRARETFRVEQKFERRGQVDPRVGDTRWRCSTSRLSNRFPTTSAIKHFKS